MRGAALLPPVAAAFWAEGRHRSCLKFSETSEDFQRAPYSFALALFAGLAASASAETWPSRPIHAIIPFGPGSAVDVVPRIVFEQLGSQLGQSIVVENRAGAGGTLGSAMVARAEPDGYTMLVHSSAHTITPALYPKLNYDIVRDFAQSAPSAACRT